MKPLSLSLAIIAMTYSSVNYAEVALPFSGLDCQWGETSIYSPFSGMVYADGIMVGDINYDASFSVLPGDQLQLVSAIEVNEPTPDNFFDEASNKLVLGCAGVLTDTYSVGLNLDSASELKFSLSLGYEVGVTPWSDTLRIRYDNDFDDSLLKYLGDDQVMLDSFSGMRDAEESDEEETVLYFGGGLSSFSIRHNFTYIDEETEETREGPGGIFDHFSQQGNFMARRETTPGSFLNLFNDRLRIELDFSGGSEPVDFEPSTALLTDNIGEFYFSDSADKPNLKVRVLDLCDEEGTLAIVAHALFGELQTGAFGAIITDTESNVTVELVFDVGEENQIESNFLSCSL